jgi:hypothetical protein
LLSFPLALSKQGGFCFFVCVFLLKAKKEKTARLCILGGESTNTTKEISLVVFFCWCDLTKGSLREGAGAEGD